MIHIKTFIDRVASSNSSIVLSLNEAKALSTEISILLADLYEKKPTEQPIKVELHGKKW